MFNVKIENLDKILNELTKKKDDVLSALKSGVDEGAKIMKTEMQSRIPSVTGNLKNSIEIEKSNNNYTAKIGPNKNVPYAYYIEFGRSKSGNTPPYPIKHKSAGVGGYHYVERTFYSEKEKVEKLIESKIKKVL